MKSGEIRKKSEKESAKMLSEKIKRLRDIRFGEANTKSKNTKEAANLRKDIARIKTILKEKEKHEK